MKERAINLKDWEVRAILKGRKTQFRRIIKPQFRRVIKPQLISVNGDELCFRDETGIFYSRYLPRFEIGDRLWVREAFSLHRAHGQDFPPGGYDHGKRWGPWSGLPISVSPDKTQVAYFREGFDRAGPPKWRPSIHMPRWASRIALEVTGTRIERLHDINEIDAIAEGVTAGKYTGLERANARTYSDIFESNNGQGTWEVNPWVQVTEFKRVEADSTAEENTNG
jgi:hypothetical protein